MAERAQSARSLEIRKTINPNGSHHGGEVVVSLASKQKDGTVGTPIGTLNVRRTEEPPGFLLRGESIGASLTGDPVFIPDIGTEDKVRTSQGSFADGFGQVTIVDLLR